MGKILKYCFPISFILIFPLAVLLPSCNTSGCMENQSSIPLAGFYSYTTGQAISVDSVKVYGVDAPNDSMLNMSLRSTSTVYLPFRADKTSTSFAFRYMQKDLDFPQLIDTITFTYESEPRFVSEECGAMFFYQITGMKYTTHLIDSVGIADSLINNFDIERIRIFFRTSEPDTNTETGLSL